MVGKLKQLHWNRLTINFFIQICCTKETLLRKRIFNRDFDRVKLMISDQDEQYKYILMYELSTKYDYRKKNGGYRVTEWCTTCKHLYPPPLSLSLSLSLSFPFSLSLSLPSFSIPFQAHKCIPSYEFVHIHCSYNTLEAYHFLFHTAQHSTASTPT